jgi:hypothetical protein
MLAALQGQTSPRLVCRGLTKRPHIRAYIVFIGSTKGQPRVCPTRRLHWHDEQPIVHRRDANCYPTIRPYGNFGATKIKAVALRYANEVIFMGGGEMYKNHHNIKYYIDSALSCIVHSQHLQIYIQSSYHQE